MIRRHLIDRSASAHPIALAFINARRAESPYCNPRDVASFNAEAVAYMNGGLSEFWVDRKVA